MRNVCLSPSPLLLFSVFVHKVSYFWGAPTFFLSPYPLLNHLSPLLLLPVFVYGSFIFYSPFFYLHHPISSLPVPFTPPPSFPLPPFPSFKTCLKFTSSSAS